MTTKMQRGKKNHNSQQKLNSNSLSSPFFYFLFLVWFDVQGVWATAQLISSSIRSNAGQPGLGTHNILLSCSPAPRVEPGQSWEQSPPTTRAKGSSPNRLQHQYFRNMRIR